MEPIGTFSDGEWDYFSRMFATDEQFLSQSSLLLGEDVELNNESMFYSFNDHAHHDHISNSQYISQENSYSSNSSSDNNAVLFSNHDHTNYYLNLDNNVLANSASCVSMDFYMDEKKIASSVPSLDDIVMEENIKLNEDAGNGSDHRLEMPTVLPIKQLQMQLKRKLDVLEVEVPPEDNINNKSENQKKKPRSLKDGQGCMKNARSKKNQKVGSCNGEEAEETNNTGSNRQSSSSNISEDDNASQENNGGATSGSLSALNSNGKTRASRGSATDPQSLYAKKRRERINERLRILQNLVPNGTKVDISTMLEEAVNYVKFLQLQIKLLSSDDLWMYAPLAYNGLDIGLNLNLNSSPQL